MTEPKVLTQTIKVGWAMADPAGTTALRNVADHCETVAAGWADLGRSMADLADSFDELVAGGPSEPDNPKETTP